MHSTYSNDVKDKFKTGIARLQTRINISVDQKCKTYKGLHNVKAKGWVPKAGEQAEI